GGLTSFSADGNKIAYNPIFRNFRTWKRYTGGLAQAIAIYDLKNHTIENVPHTDWTDTFPMWHGNTIYFTSDRGPEHHLNLYGYDLSTKQIEQFTHFDEFDVMWPSLGPDAIVFENAGYLMFPIAAAKTRSILLRTMGWARSSRSPPGTKGLSMLSPGRRIARSWGGETRIAESGMWTSMRKNRSRSIVAGRAKSCIVHGHLTP